MISNIDLDTLMRNTIAFLKKNFTLQITQKLKLTIIMDFAKAFDKVPQWHLLYKLNHFGIAGQTLNWISAFLSDRTRTVVPDGR